MTFIQRLRSLVAPAAVTPLPVVAPVPATSALADFSSALERLTSQQPDSPVPSASEPLPYWLTDEESLRDEGVLFGLADAQPDEKVAEIRAYFEQRAVPLTQQIEQYSEKIDEINLLIDRRETRMSVLRNQINSLRDRQPDPSDLLRTTVSLVLATVMSIGTFYLIDETLYPAYPNRWVPVGVFLAGMFNLFGRTSFFYEEGTRLSGRRLVEELGMPIAASVFVLAQALKTQSVWQSGAIFFFVFFLFLLTGKLLLSTLTLLQKGVRISESNRQLLRDRQQHLPEWEAITEQLEREVDAIRIQRFPAVSAMNQLESELARLNTRRDQLVNLFLSEYELARSIRDRLTEQQRKLMMNFD